VPVATSGVAAISSDGLYRYDLSRTWADGPTATWIMLNPSTADAHTDDPTIRRCMTFSRAFGCGSMVVVNLYGLRATEPAALWTAADPVGWANDAILAHHVAKAADYDTPLIGAWGGLAQPGRIAAVLALPGMDRLTALATTKAGQPKHPLYLPGHLRPQPWRAP
jgi:hypothetical protein